MDRTTEDPDARSHCKVNQLFKLMVSLLLYSLLQNHNLINTESGEYSIGMIDLYCTFVCASAQISRAATDSRSSHLDILTYLGSFGYLPNNYSQCVNFSN